MRMGWLATMAIVALGCGPASDEPDASARRDGGGSRRDGGSSYARPEPIEVPPISPPDLSGLPLDDEGLPTLPLGEDASLSFDLSRRDPLTALGACADLVAFCVSPERSLDACMVYAPVCETEEPWLEEPCCPARCAADYEALRIAGEGDVPAFVRVLFRDIECFLGVREMLEEP